MKLLYLLLPIICLPILSCGQIKVEEKHPDTLDFYFQVIDQRNPQLTELLLDSLWKHSSKSVEKYSRQALLHRRALSNSSLDSALRIKHRVKMIFCHLMGKSLDSTLQQEYYGQIDPSLGEIMEQESKRAILDYSQGVEQFTTKSVNQMIDLVGEASYDLLNSLSTLGSKINGKLDKVLQEQEDTVEMIKDAVDEIMKQQEETLENE